MPRTNMTILYKIAVHAAASRSCHARARYLSQVANGVAALLTTV